MGWATSPRFGAKTQGRRNRLPRMSIPDSAPLLIDGAEPPKCLLYLYASWEPHPGPNGWINACLLCFIPYLGYWILYFWRTLGWTSPWLQSTPDGTSTIWRKCIFKVIDLFQSPVDQRLKKHTDPLQQDPGWSNCPVSPMLSTAPRNWDHDFIQPRQESVAHPPWKVLTTFGHFCPNFSLTDPQTFRPWDPGHNKLSSSLKSNPMVT